MKRSEINARLTRARDFIAQCGFRLPPFAFFSPAEWKQRAAEYAPARAALLGWDMTDFGRGNFDKVGLIAFTVRNGSLADEKLTRPYAEKIMVVEELQETPMHFHWLKSEDIINRGGGELVIQLYNADENDQLDTTPVTVFSDGRSYTIPAGGSVTLLPGESITLLPRQYHRFYGRPGKGTVLVGEVSRVNDDATDNRFFQPAGRFPEVEEDEESRFVLCCEYDKVCK